MNAGGGGCSPNKKGSSSGSNGRWRSSGGGSGQGACFDFQRTGSCRFGSSCRFLHSMAGSNSVSGGNKRGPSKTSVCFDFRNGSCRYGSSCKFSHTSGGISGMPNSSNNVFSQKKINTNDSQRLIKQLKSIQQSQVVDAIVNAGSLWTKCWECAASSFSSSEIETLLHTLAKVPFSAEAKVEPPPIFALKDVVKKYLKNAESKGPNDSLLAAETTLNVVRKLLGFEWEDKSIVKEALGEILESAASNLQRRHSDHRDTIQRIDKCLDLLEKPWQIKERAIVSTEEIMAAGILIEDDSNLLPYHHFSRWKNATVAWLCYGPTFSPSANPKMQGPSTRSQGVYKSREHYFDTMQRLMIAMAFSEGHSALAPRCWERVSGGGHCGSALVQIPDHEDGEHGRGGSSLICRGKECNNLPSYICKQSHHNRGLCNSCAVRERSQLLGPTGSTHVYNGHVSRVDANGKIYIQGFASRKPPLDETGTKQRQIHWRSTKRLAVPNLVGVIRLGDSSCISSHAIRDLKAYRSLRLDDNIYWGEVSPHGNQSYEAQQRQQGNVCLNLTSRSIFGPDECPDVENEFSEGDVIAIIDCQSFVPEYIPVIRALEQQEQEILPFDDGALLNLDANRRADLSNTVLGPDAQNKAAAEGEFQRCIFDRFGYGPEAYSDNETKSQAYVVKTVTKLPSALIKQLVSDMICSSVLLPIREIRQNSLLSSRMQSELIQLFEKATLDFGQLVSFIDALRNPVHVTQGPPGTGKSYLGVQLVHALTIIRNYWMQVNSSVGSPPILVLSYKNHATDEFLTDLLKVIGPSLSGRSRHNSRFGSGGNAQLVRMGNPGDPTLAPYSERALALRADPNVSIREKEVQDLLDLRRACQRAQRSASLFQSYRSDMFDSDPTLDPGSIAKQQKASAYEATEVLYAALVRSHFLNTIVLQKKTVNDTDNVLQSLLDIGFVLNQDKPDDSKFKSLQKKGNSLAKGTISDILYNLFEGIQHYITSDPFYNDPYELLFMFLMGESPKPLCTYTECDATNEKVPCDHIADWYDVPLCHEHRCVHQECKREIVKSGYTLCKEHVCDSDGCDQTKMDHQLFCQDHICFQCILLGISPASEALDEPPRNVCENHGLCSVLDCHHLAVRGEDYCDQHVSTRCQFNGCNEWAIARGLPYCQQHERNKLESSSVSLIATRAGDPTLGTKTSRRQCMGKNKKKKPCKSTAMPGSDFCEAHAPQKGTGFKAHQKEREDELISVNYQDDDSEHAELKLGSHKKNPIVLAEMDQMTQADMNELETACDAIDEEEFSSPPDLDNVDLERYDKTDELIEGEGEQHIREIFDIESGDEIETDDEFQECIEKDDDVFHDCQNAVVKDPRDWMWSFSLDNRWSACQAFLYEQCDELQKVQDLVKHELPLARKRMHDAESRAKARVFENKTVIGGTIVGCIARLEQIRATRPFAIIVEEASEVMEPLLFACLSQSTVKFEMIGDHRQLAPSLMDKYDFTRINKVNVSMFERLICAPNDCCIPSGVLSVQRRMRKDICDLTREYYSDIVAIEDHPICSTKIITGKEAHRTFWQGREIPGVESHLYLWAHSGTQGKADVGLSKQNREEAQMCVNLAYYLVHCGVSKSSIAILTPYKGQLMLIRKLLLSDQSKARLLTHDSVNQDQVRLSTVDRFQGDEADVVIASLVVDERSRTGFVKLQNRMIVLLSRARIGCFILGNIGYFEHAGGKDTKHWKRTFEMLESPSDSSDNAKEKYITVNTKLVPSSMQMLQSSDETCSTITIPLSEAHFNEARVGSTFPLCCPQHPLLSRFDAKVANDLQLGFCQIACDEVLPCSHTCGLKCHWPRKTHNKKCIVKVDSPCSKHPRKLQCTDIFLNSATRPGDSIDDALKCYKCPVKVSVMLPCCHEEQLSCWHEDEIAQNKKGYPVCDKKAMSPYVYPDCGHELEVTCAQYEHYTRDPTSVKQCSKIVQYHPQDCPHTKTIKCYMEKEYRGQRKYVCPEKLTIELPRCGHEAMVSCSKNVLLEKWALGPSECQAEFGIVREGITYAGEDHKCYHPTTFIRRCGHEERMPCSRAFDMSKLAYLAPCVIRVPAVNPYCGHICDITCDNASKLKSIQKLTRSPVNVVHESDPPFPTDLPRGISRCTEQVNLLRSCGHTEEVSCGSARGLRSNCKVEVDIVSPLCGHVVSVPCWRRKSVEAWRPWKDNVEDSLARNNSLPSNAELSDKNLQLPDKEVVDILQACKKHVEVSKSCGHIYKERCRELVEILSEGGKSKKGKSCLEQVTRELPCGHQVSLMCKDWTKFTEGEVDIPCSETVEELCWNAVTCGSDVICVPCSETGVDSVYCCDKYTEWTCDAGLHTQKLQLCLNGHPNTCPECVSNDITSFIRDAKTSSMDLSLADLNNTLPGSSCDIFPLDDCVRGIRDKRKISCEAQTYRFFSALAESLAKFQSHQRKCSDNPFKQPQLKPLMLPVFYVIPHLKKNKKQDEYDRILRDGFTSIKDFIKGDTLNGIAVHHLSHQNMLDLANETKGGARKSLLIGYLCCLNPKVGCALPTGKKRMNAVKAWIDEGHDCVQFQPQKGRSLKSLIVWDPASLIAIYSIGPIDSDKIRQFSNDISSSSNESNSILENSNALVSFIAPGNKSQKLVSGRCMGGSLGKASLNNGTSVSDTHANADQLLVSHAVSSLRGTWAESFSFVRFSWKEDGATKTNALQLHNYTKKTKHDDIPANVELDLMKKMVLFNADIDNVYGGKKLLEQKIRQSEKRPAEKEDKKESHPLLTMYQLLLALEINTLGDQDRANEELEKYCTAMLRKSATTNLPSHPLLLLALYRIGMPDLPPFPKPQQWKREEVLLDFAKNATHDMLEIVLTEDEQSIIDCFQQKPTMTNVPNSPSQIITPSDEWANLKDTDGVKSDAMEDLLKMTGLLKVKQTAVKLFIQGLRLSQLDDETRKVNTPALNFVFYGNPGTGKTTVARLFSRILHDTGLRKSSNFVECDGQSIKDAGTDEFKKKANSASDGTLFMDEAYTLDPVGDKFKGGPIANSMLILAENDRDKMSLILAGYEDEMNDKLFSFNPGFKSRFTEVFFEDFDEEELLTVWKSQREKKMWRESNDQLGRVVVRRLAKMKGHKGFGNARAIRQRLEEACTRAMSRKDFDSTNLELQMEDAVGENPIHNSKLKAVLKEFDKMTGWKAVKDKLNNLVDVCGQNYERELKGQEAHPIFLNRLFLGNPGTGKTTCAQMYGRVLKELGFLSKGEVVFKTAGDLGGSVVGESKQKTLALIERCRGKVLVIDEAYGLNDNLYGKQALDTLVEKVQGTEADDIAVLLLGYEDQMTEMLDKQNPGLLRRFPKGEAFFFEDYTNTQLNDILSRYCRSKKYKPSLEFCERALKKLEMQRRSESHFGNAGSVQNLLKEAVALASKRRSEDGILRLEAEDVHLPGDSDSEEDPFASIDKLYGMGHIKIQLIKLKSQFDLADEEGEVRPNLGHFVFTGAPGTGKTTVARSMGKMLFNCGLISRSDVVETSGLQLTGEYIGSTKKVVSDHLDKANGGILFIDEAYELGKGTFGSEACSTLVEAMTNTEKYGGIVIILAGYQSDMQSMLDTNQGLKSRFNRFIEFPDWEVKDCNDYFINMVKEKNLTIQNYEQFLSLLHKGFSKLKPLKGWGNARDVVKLFESTLETRAMRVHQERSKIEETTYDTERIITENDIRAAVQCMVDSRMGSSSSASKREDTSEMDPFAELDRLYRMEMVKAKLQQLKNTYVVAERDGEDPPPLGHFIFTGSPGTGKTTVARVMSNILFDLNLTGRNHVQETTGLEMQGQYLGQTQVVVRGHLDKAKGGVLFIDEAYTLGQGQFGSEACDSLVAAMTNPEYAGVVVVIAGYPKDIDNMLRSNAGLKSRFNHTISFPNWDPSDCVNCFTNRAQSKKFNLPKNSSHILESGFKKLAALDGFGNARDVDAIWRAASLFRSDRIVSTNHPDSKEKSIEESDISKAFDEILAGRTASEGIASSRTRHIEEPLCQPPVCNNEETPSSNFDSTNLSDEFLSKEKCSVQEDTEEYSDVEPENNQAVGRDLGVSDAVWMELEQAKEAEKRYVEQCEAEEEEQKRVEAELEAQLRAKKLAEDAYRKAMEKLQRQRELAAEKERKKEMIKKKLRAIGNCPKGFVWHKMGNGWRCAGGSHYVSNEELNKSFGYDIDQ